MQISLLKTSLILPSQETQKHILVVQQKKIEYYPLVYQM